jgi:CRISPR-associated protein Cas2
MTFYVIAYDIPDNRRRNRIARLLAGFGLRIQKSVFECDLDTDRLQRLRHELSAETDPGEDKVRFYPLCSGDLSRALVWDKSGLHWPQRVWVV